MSRVNDESDGALVSFVNDAAAKDVAAGKMRTLLPAMSFTPAAVMEINEFAVDVAMLKLALMAFKSTIEMKIF